MCPIMSNLVQFGLQNCCFSFSKHCKYCKDIASIAKGIANIVRLYKNTCYGKT